MSRMRQQILVTATGEDRPGIVARLSEVILKHGANLEESRMALLGGEFAVIALVTVGDDKLHELTQELVRLKDEDIFCTTKATKPLSPDRFKECISCELELSGADHEGIVHGITRFLREHSINIQSMESGVVNAPETGTPLFCMRATIQVPPALSISQLSKELNAIGDNESVEITLSALPQAVAR
jgi:glycine cleavage system transcriptional repressor